MNSTFTQGTINITINNTPLEIPDGSHTTFSLFSASLFLRLFLVLRSWLLYTDADAAMCVDRDLTQNQALPFQLEGQARAVANMSIGQITLDPIKFNVTSGLSGLQGLKDMVKIGTVDVVGGSTEAIHLAIPGACRISV